MSVRELGMGTVSVTAVKFNHFRQIKEIKHLSGGVALYAAQSNVPIDAEVAEKGGFRTETS